MFEIKVNPKNEIVIYPDIANNLEQSENDRFAVVIAKKHKLIVQTAAIGSDGKLDVIQFAKLHVVRIDNAPMLNMGKTKRALTIDDIFKVPELETVANEIFDKVAEIQKLKGVDLKN
jgi:hypothetical protein